MELLISIIPLIVGIVSTFLATWFWKYKSKNDAYKVSIDNKLASLELQIVALNTQISPFWAAVQTKIAKDLTHPHIQFKEMDELLLELENLTITINGRARLLELINERIISIDPKVSQSEKNSAKIMKIVMEKVVTEANESASEIST